MSSKLSAKLTVTADRRFLPMVQGYFREVAIIAGLPDKEVVALELAGEEAFMNIMTHAYPDGRNSEITISAEFGPAELIILVQDQGLPYYRSIENEPVVKPETQGIGLRLIRQAVDEACFVSLGLRGKQLRLVKRLSRSFAPSEDNFFSTLEKAPEQEYVIRITRPEDAISVARALWMTYGYSYPKEEAYRPEGLLGLIENGRLVSMVVVAENGEIAGHACLVREDPTPIAEAAMLFVAPAHRNRGLMEKLGLAAEQKAREMGLIGLVHHPVTSHAISQKQVVGRGGKACALNLASIQPTPFKALVRDDSVTQRESFLICFTYLSTPPPALAHAPESYQDIIAKIYHNLSRPAEFGRPAPAVGGGDYQVKFNRELGLGVIRVLTANQDQWPEIKRAVADLTDIAQAQAVYLDLPLAQPASALLGDLARQAGFFLAGVHLHEAMDGDLLRLQRLNVDFDFTRLRFHPGFGEELAKYVQKDKERLERKSLLL
ncbi:MAG: GNAT family N-acetyltransferase [Deltaproteobacteria bacterium]|nr:GNAT family N-acetyltransferase [Deltaproteobacteria bacterium]